MQMPFNAAGSLFIITILFFISSSSRNQFIDIFIQYSSLVFETRENFSVIETRTFDVSHEFRRLSNFDEILNDLDLLTPNFTVDPRTLTIKDLVLLSAWSLNHHEDGMYAIRI
jgi:hypothetical protein